MPNYAKNVFGMPMKYEVDPETRMIHHMNFSATLFYPPECEGASADLEADVHIKFSATRTRKHHPNIQCEMRIYYPQNVKGSNRQQTITMKHYSTYQQIIDKINETCEELILELDNGIAVGEYDGKFLSHGWKIYV